MAYVCTELQTVNNVQTCVTWADFSFLSSLAITKAQMVGIGGSIMGVMSLFIAYAIISKGVRSL